MSKQKQSKRDKKKESNWNWARTRLSQPHWIQYLFWESIEFTFFSVIRTKHQLIKIPDKERWMPIVDSNVLCVADKEWKRGKKREKEREKERGEREREKTKGGKKRNKHTKVKEKGSEFELTDSLRECRGNKGEAAPAVTTALFFFYRGTERRREERERRGGKEGER